MVSPEARALIGQVAEERSGTVDKKEFQRWAAAVGDLNPLYFDDAAARAAGYREVVMPPMFLSQVLNDVIFLDSLRPDGIRGDGVVLPVPERRMAAGEETSYYQPVYPGDVLTSRRTLADLAEKQGRSGAFVLVTWEVTYHNQDGDLVARSTSATIAR